MEQLIFVVILAVLGIGKWFLDNAGSSRDDADFPEPPRRNPNPPAPRPNVPAGGDSDEERVRRFMEALGLPSNQLPQPPQRRAVAGPKAEKTPAPQPKPDMRHLGEPFGRPRQPVIRRRMEAPGAPRREPAPVSRPPEPSHSLVTGPSLAPTVAPMSENAPAMEVVSLGSLPDPGRAVETAGAGVESAARLQPAGAVQGQAGQGLADLKTQLRNPAALRRAILLREILGEPKGLQSAASPSILRIP